jgi:hypothetical protein
MGFELSGKEGDIAAIPQIFLWIILPLYKLTGWGDTGRSFR